MVHASFMSLLATMSPFAPPKAAAAGQAIYHAKLLSSRVKHSLRTCLLEQNATMPAQRGQSYFCRAVFQKKKIFFFFFFPQKSPSIFPLLGLVDEANESLTVHPSQGSRYFRPPPSGLVISFHRSNPKFQSDESTRASAVESTLPRRRRCRRLSILALTSVSP